MKKGLLLLAILIVTIQVFAKGPTYKKVKIWFDGKPTSLLSSAGVDLLEGEFRKGVWFISDFNDQEIETINHAGFRTEILISDVQQYYRERSTNRDNVRSESAVGCQSSSPNQYQTPSHFYLGSMGGFFTYNQLLNILDSMQLLYPNLITIKQPIDPTPSIEGRPIYYVKISDNPNVQESEPEVLYTAIHHAREPESLSQLVFYMWYLLENYSADSTIKNLVDNTQMFFAPCLNPDGYIYNETTDPNGGGLWRKNRRDNLDGEFGVDLNRNYGYEFGYDTIGSSIHTNGSTYRGTGAFSEPETQAIRNFTNSHNFKLALNYHTYGSHLVQPWGFIPDFYPPDSLQYYDYGYSITAQNNYHVGTPNQTVNYTVNGSSDDWMYGDVSSKPKVFAWTPEVGTGSDGFWPMINRIIPLCNENMFANITMARLAGRYGKVYAHPPTYISQTSNNFIYDFRLLGLDTTGIFTVTLQPLSLNVISSGAEHNYSGLNLLQLVHDSITYNLDPSIQVGDAISFVVSVNNGLYLTTDTFVQYYGTPTPILSENGSTINNWNSGTLWNTTTEDFVSPTTSITDSPFSTYINNGSSEIVLGTAIDLSGVIKAEVSFMAKWEIEKGFDYVVFQASTDGGSTWTSLCGKYTTPGTSSQLLGEPLYDGNQTLWVKEEVDLSAFVGQTIQLRFNLVSDQFQEFDGFYFDDLLIETLSNNVGIAQSKPLIYISSAWPNPSNNSSSVTFSQAEKGDRLEIVNSFGQLIWTKEISTTSGVIELPAASLRAGIYNYYIVEGRGGKSKIQKLIIVK